MKLEMLCKIIAAHICSLPFHILRIEHGSRFNRSRSRSALHPTTMALDIAACMSHTFCHMILQLPFFGASPKKVPRCAVIRGCFTCLSFMFSYSSNLTSHSHNVIEASSLWERETFFFISHFSLLSHVFF